MTHAELKKAAARAEISGMAVTVVATNKSYAIDLYAPDAERILSTESLSRAEAVMKGWEACQEFTARRGK